MIEKLVDLRDAVAEHLRAGDSVVLGACLEPDVPFAATHEIIRQGLRDLNVVAPISDASTDMLIGAGCCAEVTGAWVGNVSGGLGHNYRRAYEKYQGVAPQLLCVDFSRPSLSDAVDSELHRGPEGRQDAEIADDGNHGAAELSSTFVWSYSVPSSVRYCSSCLTSITSEWNSAPSQVPSTTTPIPSWNSCCGAP